MKDSFVFYRSFYNAIKKVEDKNLKSDIFDAICELALNENEVNIENNIGCIIMDLIKPQIIANNERYTNGKKGGRPKKTIGYEEKNHRLSNTKTIGYENKKPNVNENVNENVNVNDIKYIVDYLNQKANTKYKSTTNKTKTLINARFNEGFTKEDFIKVIDNKTKEWLNDEKMCKFLRPETLFGTKFESYLNQKNAKEKQPEWHFEIDEDGFNRRVLS